MTATVSGRVAAFLRLAGLIVGMLALIVGILGMHVMAASHTNHAAPAAGHGTGVLYAAASTAPGQAAPSHLAAHSHPAAHIHPAAPAVAQGAAAMPAPAAAQGTTETAPCPEPGSCPSAASPGAVCIPALGTASLAAPPPGSTPFWVHAAAGLAATVVAHIYLPGSPSPGELCISRT